MTAAALMLALAALLAGCAATETMWAEPGYSAGYVYTRPARA